MTPFSKHSVLDVAKGAGLTVEHVDDMPTKYDGHLDTHAEPRFIAVKRDLHPAHQTYVIAREVGRYAHHRRFNSPILNRPWKWKVLEDAPDEIKQRICKLDAECRAYFLMVFCATRADFISFVKRNPGTVWSIMYADNLVSFLLFKIRVKRFLSAFCRSLAF